MISIEDLSENAIGITVIAEFRQADVDVLIEFVKEQRARQKDGAGGGNLLIDLTAMADFSWSAVVEELGHMGMFLKYIYSLDRIAIISDEEWVRTAARLESALLPGVEYQVYDEDEAGAARAWILQQIDQPHKGACHPLDISKLPIAAFELSGRLDRKEAERGVAMVRAALEDPECSRLMVVIRNWHGFDAESAISPEVIAGKLELLKHLDRYAIVGGPGWLRNLASFMGALIKPEIKSFDLDEQETAIAWLSEQ